MKQIIGEFSGKCITSVKNWHSSTVEFRFDTGDSRTGQSPSLTLDFCVWDLGLDKKLLIGSNDAELEQKLAILIGDTISRISQIMSFSPRGRDDPEQGIFGYGKVVVTFGSQRKLFIYPHSWDEETYKGDGSAPLMTLPGRSSKLIYLENGEIQHSSR